MPYPPRRMMSREERGCHAKPTRGSVCACTGFFTRGGFSAWKSLGGVAGKMVGQNKSGGGRSRETPRRWRNVELREEIRFATFDFAWLAIDLESNPKIHGQCSRDIPVVQREEIGSVCTLPHVGNSRSHAGKENV